MIYCIWSPLIIPTPEIPPHTQRYFPKCLFIPIILWVFLLLQGFKYQPQTEMTVFFAGNQIFLERGVITIGAALVTESCVISQLVCHSLDSSTDSEII